MSDDDDTASEGQLHHLGMQGVRMHACKCCIECTDIANMFMLK